MANNCKPWNERNNDLKNASANFLKDIKKSNWNNESNYLFITFFRVQFIREISWQKNILALLYALLTCLQPDTLPQPNLSLQAYDFI